MGRDRLARVVVSSRALAAVIVAIVVAAGLAVLLGFAGPAASEPRAVSDADGRLLLMGVFAVVGAAVILRTRGDL